MRKFARIEKDKVVEVFDLDEHFPTATGVDGLFHPNMKWVPAPNAVAEGWLLRGNAVVPPDDLAEVLDRVDQAAGAARARYITIAPGQEATYIAKAAAAAEYKAAGYIGTIPLMVQAEADAVGCTPTEAANAILAQESAWMVLAAQIESCRRSWKLALAVSANRLADVEAAIVELEAM